MRTGGIVCFGVLLSTVSLLGVDRSFAAVRVCDKHVTSGVMRSEVENAARRAAIQDWLKKARSKTVAHPSWRIAYLKVIKCVKQDSVYECVAHAQPCTIKQKPPERKEKRPRLPKATGGSDV